ncbi:hypothetical protein R1flu_011774 [Riccia fluitans]|uniref:Uncharacterized protein n=1 Tax=Riccia fluitans TaxID=41844 RepID=A0ABD1Z8Q6_9MARC
MYVLNMPKYVTSLQRYCAHEDIFLWDIMNTNVEGDRLLLKDTRGGTNIIGRNEIAIVFGAKHKKKEDFRSIKRYKEILYYKAAAPYGPTLHGHNYNWGKAILHGLQRKILFLQSRACNNDGGKTILCEEKATEETHQQKLAQVQTELEEYKRSSKAMIKRLDKEASRLQEALAAKESVVKTLVVAHQKEISTLKTTCQKYKTTFDGEIGTNADLHTRVQNLKDELNASKYTQE